ncbi:MAG: peptidylprolyl isomerase [Saprospiraceae bacterium]
MKNLSIRLCWGIILIAYFTGCIPKTDTPLTSVETNFKDKEVQQIINQLGRQNLDSIYIFLHHKNPSYRYHALQMLASLRDKSSIDSIAPLLSDPIMEVRAKAAFALGQLGHEKAAQILLNAFATKDTLSVNNISNANILEAIGKTGSLSLLKSLANVKTYRPTDSLLISGQMKAIYRFMLRNITSPEGSKTALRLLKDVRHTKELKLYAAHYFARGKDLDVNEYGPEFRSILNTTKDIELRLPLITALGKTKDFRVLASLKSYLISENDPRAIVNTIKSLGFFPYDSVRLNIALFLKNNNPQISITASQYFLQHGIKEDLEFYRLNISDSLHWKVKANMYGCLLKHAPIYNTKYKGLVTTEIKTLFDKSNNAYEKAQLVLALSQDPFNYLLLGQLNHHNIPVIKTSIVEGYKNILTSPNFFKAFGYGYPKIKAQILESLVSILQKNDEGTTSIVAQILREPSLSWREWIKDTDFLKEALSKIKLPSGMEAYRELDKTIQYLQSKEYVTLKSANHKPIQWDIINSCTDSSAVAVKTTKGTFRIRLFAQRAPYSVSNFLQLVQNNYFNQKIIHRLEPNFVIQTGCPRGDGYGSLDYTIPSELTSGSYTSTGLVGMASAGNHTECSQWFVTHSPSPHLDANYTIFGSIVEGMDVVNKLDIGDKIIEIIYIR